jgi:hypothetical protein
LHRTELVSGELVENHHHALGIEGPGRSAKEFPVLLGKKPMNYVEE